MEDEYSLEIEAETHEASQYDELINKMKSLRDIYTKAGMKSTPIQFPQIVVIGGQSSGKSSVLENFVGKDFLPRGTGTVTRCPLVLNLVHTNTPKEYAYFDHKGETEYTNFEEIKKEIVKQTSNLVGSNHGISENPIKLTIHSPNVVNLTLVDLPGVTRVSKGDQPKDIEKITRNMIMDYIKDENCIILAVSAANQDLNTSDALMLAKEVDPEGTRTIGVLTKIDIMDKGTNALSELQGNGLFPLRLGYVAVLNRSQEDIDAGIDIVEARRKENNFFAKHPIYGDMANRLGSTYLQKILNTILTRKIHEKLPELKHTLEQQYLEYELKQQKFCGFLEERQRIQEMDEHEKMNHLRRERAKQLNSMFNEFCKEIGRMDFGSVDLDKVSRGALINEIITDWHSRKIDEICLNREELTKKLKVAILNVRGAHGGIFTPDRAFSEVINYIITQLGEPSKECLSQVTNLLRQVVDDCVKKAHRYPNLRDSARSLLKSFVGHSMRETQEHIKYVIEFQKSMINDHHEDFFPINNMSDTIKRIPISSVATNIATGLTTNRVDTVVREIPNVINAATDEIEDNILEPIEEALHSRTTSESELNNERDFDNDYTVKMEMIESYAKILRKAFKDFVPKVILHSLIDETKNYFNVDLDSELDAKFPTMDLMEICEDERMEVEEFLRKKSVLEQAMTEISNI